jgi:putative membrane protein
MYWEKLAIGIFETAVYSLVGIVMMGFCFLLVRLFTPFSIKKEIEDDQNTSLGIIIGAIILGISIIVASVINSPSTYNQVSSPPAEKEVSETQK